MDGPEFLYLNVRKPRQWLRLYRKLRARSFDLLYVNSLWDPTFTVIPVFLARLRIIRAGRILLAPRGELSQGALSLKNRKKQAFLRLWRPFLESMDVVWNASSEMEAADISAVFPRARIEVIEDRVSLPFEPLPPVLRSKGPARWVFIGRIAVMKNLDLTLKSLRHLSQPVEFDIYGPVDDATYWSKCKLLIKDLPPEFRVRYLGELPPAEVRTTFARYDAFVFPTLGEGFGHAILESLSASCPVICSAETLWTSVLRDGGGAVVEELTTGGLSRELARFAAMGAEERLSLRRAAGDAYRTWRSGHNTPNVLEQMRKAALICNE